MLKPNEIERASTVLDEPMRALENQVMEDIVRRIKINGEITRSADWQMHRLYEMGMSKADIKQALKDNLNFDDKDILELYKKVYKAGYSHDEEIYLKKGLTQVPFEENLPLQQLISAVAEQTAQEIKNISQSLGFAVKQTDGKLKFQPIAEYYQNTLDNAIMGIASGVFDYNTVLKHVVSEMTNSGLRTVDYATGWSNRVDVAGRRAIMTGMSQLTAKVNEDNAKELKTEYFEVTWHSGARPSHQEWQGKVYSRQQLETVCGLGTVTGLCGANCYHDYYPFIPGISERTYTDEQLAELNAEDNRKREYQGKQYTKYEALQRQRRLETTLRAQRQQIKLLKDGGADEDDIINARCRYQGALQEYNRFSRSMDLPVQRDRIYVDGLGNIGVGKYKKAVDKSAESGIIKAKKPDYSRATYEILHQCEANKVAYNKVEKLSKQIDNSEIINRLAGGDMTSGSCASLGFAYIGNKHGLDVLDFRGGNSQNIFSRFSTLKKVLELPNVQGSVVKVKKEAAETAELLKKLECSKEYFVAAGKHAAIVRNTEKGLEYLELQSSVQNGWTSFNKYGSTVMTLQKRFGCRKTVDKSYGMVWEKSVIMMDVDSFANNGDFQHILGYINTFADKQKKGLSGSVK